MGFMDECQDILEKRHKEKDEQPAKILNEQVNEFAKRIKHIIKQLLNKGYYIIDKNGNKIVRFFEPYPYLELSQGKRKCIRTGFGIFHTNREKNISKLWK